MSIINKEGTVIANNARRIVVFETLAEYDAWVAGLPHPDDAGNFGIIKRYTKGGPTLCIKGIQDLLFEDYKDTVNSYVPNYEYSQYELIIHENKLYRSIYWTTSGDTFKPEDWELIEFKKEIYNFSAQAFPSGAIVVSNHQAYRTKKVVPAGTQLTDTNYFESIFSIDPGSTFALAPETGDNPKKTSTIHGFNLVKGSVINLFLLFKNSTKNFTLNINNTGEYPVVLDASFGVPGFPVETSGDYQKFLLQFTGDKWIIMIPATLASHNHFLLQMTFGGLLAVGDSYSVSCSSGTVATGKVPANLKAEIFLPYADTEYTITSGAVSQKFKTGNVFTVDSITFGEPSFSECPWPIIGQLSAANKIPASWNIGDSKDITLSTGEVINMQIYGKKHDDLASGGKAQLTLGMSHVTNDSYQMNEDSSNTGGFVVTSLYRWLQNELYNSLPEEVKPLIKLVVKRTSIGNTRPDISLDNMKIFLFSEVETFPACHISAYGEGTTYPIFTSMNARRRRNINRPTKDCGWRLRGPQLNHAAHFAIIKADGGPSVAINDQFCAINFGFCI